MYDRENLYISYHFKDATPMVNNVNPETQPDNGWCSDCVQMRIWTDPDKTDGQSRVAHLDAYYYTPGKEPVARIRYQDMAVRGTPPEGIIPNAVGQGVEEAFLIDADGAGYVQEMKIPFKLLRRGGAPYVAGDSFRMGLEFLWGDGTGLHFPRHRYADLINPEQPMRLFFWSSKNSWGIVKFMVQGNLAPSPSIGLLSKTARRRFCDAGGRNSRGQAGPQLDS